MRIGRVRQGRTAQHDAVNAALGHGLGRQVRIVHAPAAEDGDLDRLFRGLGQGQDPALFHVAGGCGVIEGVVLAKVHAQAVVAIGFQALGDLQALFQRPAYLVLAVEGGVVVALDIALEGQAHGHHKVAAAGGLHPIQDLTGTAQAVL